MENEAASQPVPIKNNQKKMVVVIVIALVITLAIIAAAFYFWQKMQQENMAADYQRRLDQVRMENRRNGAMNNYPGNNFNPPSNFSETNEEYAEETDKSLIALDKIEVAWNKKPEEVKDKCGDQYTKCYRLGTITNDDPAYKGKTFYLEVSEGLGSILRHYVIMDENTPSEYKAYAEGNDAENIVVPIAGVSNIPEEITMPGTSVRMKKHYSPSNLFQDLSIKKKVFEDRDLGQIYMVDGGCLVAELPDHTAIAYDFVLPFVSEENRVINVTFDGGKANKEEYDYAEHTCNATCTYLMDKDESDLKPEKRLETIGKTVNGDNVYRIKDSNDKVLKDLYNDKNTMPYIDGDWQDKSRKSKYSYSEFISLNPLLYWQDPIGRWIEFKNSKFAIAAEMCKPVIYLYPETQMSLGVKVSPNGGFTHTEPEYNSGWNVEADPGGRIKDLSTGQYYDSLLWEGIGIKYPEQDQGWMVKKEDLDGFLGEKLETLGLNNKEISDFKEYWLGRLDEKPFYKISFLSRNQFDSLAPVDFSVKPKVFIRVMMTAKGMDNYEDITPQILPKTPTRTGFTAVEWGGTLLK